MYTCIHNLQEHLIRGPRGLRSSWAAAEQQLRPWGPGRGQEEAKPSRQPVAQQVPRSCAVRPPTPALLGLGVQGAPPHGNLCKGAGSPSSRVGKKSSGPPLPCISAELPPGHLLGHCWFFNRVLLIDRRLSLYFETSECGVCCCSNLPNRS